MALADTAKLVASLELQDKFSNTASKFDRTVAGMEQKTGTLGRIGGRITSGVGTAVGNLQRIGLVAGGVLAANVAAGVQSLDKLENVETQTKAVLKSTSGAAGETADDIRKLAEQYENLNATVDDKVIQSGENLLLTFTAIDKKGFQPALQAALDMNQAMGGGEEGLQNTIIRVGKALQDPIRGATALRRVGVNLTEQQQKQIKTLVDSNRLYDAQQLILKELSKEFGGSFAAAGATATAKFAKFRDAIEDAQQSLATAFLPLLTKVADKLSTFLADPKVQAQIEDFGKGLASGLDQVVEFAGKLPWQQIGDSFKLAGQGAKIILDAFVGLPPWVQTAVLTGWGLNKLTGGALTGIVGELGKGLIGQFAARGATPANPLFVSDVTGGLGGGAAGAGGGLLGTAAKFIIGPAIAAELGNLIGHSLFFDPQVKPTVEVEKSQFAQFLERNQDDPQKLQHGLDAIQKGIDDLPPLAHILASDQTAELEKQRDLTQQALDAARKQQDAAFENNRQNEDLIDAAKRGATASERAAESSKTLEQKLVNDSSFRQHVTTPEQFLRLLRRTSEFGEKGTGTTIEQGRRTGRDPVGDAFVALARRLTPPALKSVEVQGEISRHIKALEQVQGRLLKEGNVAEARHAQRNIDKLGALIGVVDKTIPHFRELERKADQQKAQERETAAQTANHLRIMQSLERRTGDQTAIVARKNFSPKVHVNVTANTTVSVNDIVRSITHTNTAVGSGPGGPAPVGVLG